MTLADLPILVEVVLVFGGALAFGWWQLRDLRLEREKRARREQRRREDEARATPTPADAASARGGDAP